MNDDNLQPAPIAQVDVPSGLRGARSLMLHPFCIVERSRDYLETIPLGALASVSAAFERDEKKLQRGVLLIIAALIVFAIAGPLDSLAGGAAAEMASRLGDGAGGGASVTRLLYATLDLLDTLAKLLPAAAAALALWGIWRTVQGVLGTTTLTLVFGGAQREYAVRGRAAKLFDFAETVGRGIGRVKL
jgi:hypothetical protein